MMGSPHTRRLKDVKKDLKKAKCENCTIFTCFIFFRFLLFSGIFEKV